MGFLDIKDDDGRALEAELRADGAEVAYERADLTRTPELRDAVARVAEAFGPLAVSVHNAAHDERHPTEDVTPEYWDDRIAVNLRHPFSQAVLPGMKAAGGGAIIDFGSVSWMVGQGGMAAYTAAKSAVLGLTRSLARDYGPTTSASTPSPPAGS